MADIGVAHGSAGVSFLVSAGIVYEIVAAACSSPQTAEINANKRADTLMKWVHMGMGQAVVFIVIAALLSDKPLAVLSGGTLAGGLLYAQYKHALKAGLRSCEMGTED
jgi:ribose 5-phosphate isomerase RpiB